MAMPTTGVWAGSFGPLSSYSNHIGEPLIPDGLGNARTSLFGVTVRFTSKLSTIWLCGVTLSSEYAETGAEIFRKLHGSDVKSRVTGLTRLLDSGNPTSRY